MLPFDISILEREISFSVFFCSKKVQEPFLDDAKTCLAAHFNVYDEFEKRIINPDEELIGRKCFYSDLGRYVWLDCSHFNGCVTPLTHAT